MDGKERLQRLVTVLEGVRDDPAKAKEFDLSYWGVQTPSCGTHLCACGWGAMDPVLSEEGLRLVDDEIRQPHNGTIHFRLAYEHRSHMEAAAAFFSLYVDAASYLFDPEYYPDGGKSTLEEVIGRIKQRLVDPDAQDDEIEMLEMDL